MKKIRQPSRKKIKVPLRWFEVRLKERKEYTSIIQGYIRYPKVCKEKQSFSNIFNMEQ